MNREVHHLTGLGVQLLHMARTHVVRLAQDTAGDAHHLWDEHQRLMDTHGVYRAVVTSGVGLLGRQLDVESVVLAVVSALIRERTRATPSRFGNEWDTDPDDWPT